LLTTIVRQLAVAIKSPPKPLSGLKKKPDLPLESLEVVAELKIGAFSFSPASGHIPPGQSRDITVSFDALGGAPVIPQIVEEVDKAKAKPAGKKLSNKEDKDRKTEESASLPPVLESPFSLALLRELVEIDVSMRDPNIGEPHSSYPGSSSNTDNR
jgi:hypothetical protein